MITADLVEIWKILNPEKRRFTFANVISKLVYDNIIERKATTPNNNERKWEKIYSK